MLRSLRHALIPPLLGLSLLALCSLTLSSCQALKKDRNPEPIEGTTDSPEGPTYLVGIVELVNPDQNFVMIKTEGGMVLPVGHTLSALDATGTWSELEITPEKKEHRITADVKSGSPRIGNLVVYRPQQQEGATPLAPAAPPPSPFPANPTRPPSIGPLQDGFPSQPPPIAPYHPDGTPQRPPSIAPYQPAADPLAPVTIGPSDPIPSAPPALEPIPVAE